TMLKDVLEDQLALSGALPRTLVSLLFRPGHLTNEYIRGRIVSYIAPFRLYLVASVVFFVLFSFFGLAALERAQVSVTEFENVARTREALAEFERELAAMDTAAMPEPARAALRMSLANLQTAFAQAIEDSTAAARTFAEMTGQVRRMYPHRRRLRTHLLRKPRRAQRRLRSRPRGGRQSQTGTTRHRPGRPMRPGVPTRARWPRAPVRKHRRS